MSTSRDGVASVDVSKTLQTALRFPGNGQMFANGGSGSGGGGGGRIAMWFTDNSFRGQFNAIGGNGLYESGGAGKRLGLIEVEKCKVSAETT